MKVGFTATRLGMTEEQAATLMQGLHALGATELHHGDCQGGDQQAHRIARQLGLRIVGYPPSAAGLRAYCDCDELRPEQEFLIRNRALVLATEYLIAAPEGPERLRSGTWSTVRYARRIGSPSSVISPTGEALPAFGA